MDHLYQEAELNITYLCHTSAWQTIWNSGEIILAKIYTTLTNFELNFFFLCSWENSLILMNLYDAIFA